MAACDDINKLEQFFREADLNGDGQLTFEELWTVIRKYNKNYPREKIKGFFQLADADGSGTLSLPEFLQAMDDTKPQPHGEDRMKCIFRLLDKDHNGRIDCKELQSLCLDMGSYVNQEDLSHFIAKYDKSKSGSLDFNEFKDAFPHLQLKDTAPIPRGTA